MLPRKVWCIWVGGHAMSPARAKCLETVRANVGVPVELITDENLAEYILPEHPLHEGYQYLCATFKCDYLRTYFMHHYGGGYADIKETTGSWVPHFDRLENDPKAWALGYREAQPDHIAAVEDKDLYGAMQSVYTRIIGNCGYICKPRTPFTMAWYQTLLVKMDEYLPELRLHPAKGARDCKGPGSQFPIPWAGILGHIFHPLCLAYLDRLLYDLPAPNCSYYSYI